jgi:hypothetical protein
MEQTVSKHRARPLVSEAKIQRDIAIYKRHMMGLSIRAIQDEFVIKSTQTVHLAIQRGREYVIDRGIDVEERRIEIDQLFNETLGLLIKTARHQSEKGVEEFFIDQNGNKSMKRRPGVDPRIAGELSRSLNRWAEFCGLLERAPEVNQSTTLIQLATPADGASFADRWSEGAVTVEAKPDGQGIGQLGEVKA